MGACKTAADQWAVCQIVPQFRAKKIRAYGAERPSRGFVERTGDFAGLPGNGLGGKRDWSLADPDEGTANSNR
jgi:hypothetical protein